MDVRKELEYKHLTAPKRLELSSAGFVVAEYELSDDELSDARPLRAFAEKRLLAIREALLPSGYKDYRVNINGTPPGTGLVRRYGAARFIDGGSLEWITR